MCGEIRADQYKTVVNVRLTTNGNETTVTLNKQIQNVEEVRLSEVLGVGFNGGVSTGVYVDVRHPQLSDVNISDNNRPGALVCLEINTPHTVYGNKLIATGSLATVNSFRVSVQLPTGASVLFTELYLVLTFVSRVSHLVSASAREAQALMDVPQMKGADPRQTFLWH
jgi:hypothetical protein